MHEGFPQCTPHSVCNGTQALTAELMNMCATSGSTEQIGSDMMRAALMYGMHVCMYIYIHICALQPAALNSTSCDSLAACRGNEVFLCTGLARPSGLQCGHWVVVHNFTNLYYRCEQTC
jgi:hypothetical protein